MYVIHQHMVVIRQDAPGINAGGKLFAGRQQVSFKTGHPFMGQTDVMLMLVASSGNEELPQPVEFHVRRRVERVLMQPAVFHSFELLSRRHFAIVVHDARTVENRRLEFNLQVASERSPHKPGILHGAWYSQFERR